MMREMAMTTCLLLYLANDERNGYDNVFASYLANDERNGYDNLFVPYLANDEIKGYDNLFASVPDQ